MKLSIRQEVEEAKQTALKVLLHNAHGPYHGLPRTAGWGYPEPNTRDLMLSILGWQTYGTGLANLVCCALPVRRKMCGRKKNTLF